VPPLEPQQRLILHEIQRPAMALLPGVVALFPSTAARPLLPSAAARPLLPSLASSPWRGGPTPPPPRDTAPSTSRTFDLQTPTGA
jgi:hypothetical protein